MSWTGCGNRRSQSDGLESSPLNALGLPYLHRACMASIGEWRRRGSLLDIYAAGSILPSVA